MSPSRASAPEPARPTTRRAQPPTDQPGRYATRGLPAFFGLTYAVTWICFGAAALLPHTAAAPRLGLLLLGAFGPSAVGLGLTARENGRAGVRALLARLLRWRVHPGWYLFAVGFLAAIKEVGALGQRLVTGHWPPMGHQPWYAILALILVGWIVGGPLGEELGWRGYALPRLTDRFGPGPAGVLLGPVWACWHLPLFVLPTLSTVGDQYGQSFPTYLLLVTALSVALAWLMQHTGGSLLLAVLMHSAINQTKDLVPASVVGAHHWWAFSTSTPAWITVVLLWVCAVYFVIRLGAVPGRRQHTPSPVRTP